jgi:hypothetical protein
MANSPNSIAVCREVHSYTKLRKQIYRDPSLWSTYAELQRQIYRHARLWGRPLPSCFTHLKKVAAMIVMAAFAFWLGFGVSTYQTPRASYPYYDTQKPVPPWSEPMALEGNVGRGPEHK